MRINPGLWRSGFRGVLLEQLARHALVVAALLRTAVMGIAAIGAGAASASGLDGLSGTFAIHSPTTSSTVAGPVAFTFGGQTAVIPNFGFIDWSVAGSGHTLTLGFNDRGCCTSPAEFSGPVVSIVDNTFPGLGSVSVATTNIVGFDSTRVSFTNDSIFVNIQGGLDLRNNRQVVLVLTPVPEPASYAMLLAGLGLLAGVWVRPRTNKMVGAFR